MSELVINYKPREYQKLLHEDNSRWKVLVWHRGSGKTTACLAELIKRAMLKKGVYEFISPTYTQSKRNARPILKDLVKGWGNTDTNESELKLTLPNKSIIYLLGSDNPDSLRGLDYHGVIYDEYSQQPGNVHGEIVRPRLSITNGWAIWIGTPKGFNQLHELFERGKVESTWLSQLLTVDDTGIISREELDAAMKEMTHDEFEQEFMCNFNAAIKGAYYAKEISIARTAGRIKKGLYDPTRQVYTAWDLGMKDYTSIIFAQLDGLQLNIIDFYESNGKSLEHYVHVLEDKQYRYGGHYFPHDARQRAKQTAISDIVHMRSFLGEDKCFIVDNHKIYDGIRKARLLFPNIMIDDGSCQELLNALTQYTKERDDKKGMFRDVPKHDRTSHAADAFRYMCMSYENIVQKIGKKTRKKRKLRIVNPSTGAVTFREI